MEPVNGWTVIRRRTNLLLPSSSVGYLSFGASLYNIVIDEHVNWTTAQEICICHGGKLAEFETAGENEYIKNELRTLDAAVDGYWLGGYNFNYDNDMEWISHPDQVMPFHDMWPGQPNGPTDQLCLVHWKPWDYKWGDNFCDDTLPYICEFE
ncbi:MRC [Mytilus coruscus]|uniref:MRC n=1 Tax=Mytilus coruscus TaxID=42192 RepID=A0A6J8DY97_MYTCO|nr:MRC [Mytilus coruscus]